MMASRWARSGSVCCVDNILVYGVKPKDQMDEIETKFELKKGSVQEPDTCLADCQKFAGECCLQTALQRQSMKWKGGFCHFVVARAGNLSFLLRFSKRCLRLEI